MKNNLDALKREYNEIPVPAEALNRINLGIDKAKAEENVIPLLPPRRAGKFAIAAAAAFAACLITVNTSETVALAAADIPVIGGFFKVITLREYSIDEGDLSVTASVPGVSSNEGTSAENVTEDASEYIEEIISHFKEGYEGGYEGLDISYGVVADTDRYFSLDITAVETGAGAAEFHRFYTIDKKTDSILVLSDLFEGDSYIDEISDEVIRQMSLDVDNDYFISPNANIEDIGAEGRVAIDTDAEGFEKIDPNQNFYINADGRLVICFDEYEVGPGSTGAPQFVMPESIF